MSEAMTNSEIEDVLSSIRRLVAQEAPPVVPTPAAERPVSDRLILTAEHRVTQANLNVVPLGTLPEPPVQPQPPAPHPVETSQSAAPAWPEPAAAEFDAEDLPVDRAGLEAAISELEAVLGPQPPLAAPAAETPSRTEPPAQDGGPPAEGEFALIDEDDLQLLVARLVREELRGQLGEKVTTLIRKLVRAEIAKALDERDLLG